MHNDKKGLLYYIGKHMDFYCESVVDQEELYRAVNVSALTSPSKLCGLV